MIKKVFYNSSLARAGSTLIQNILAQNPDIHATPTSGVFEMLMGCRTIFSNGLEFKAQDQTQMETGFKGLLKGAIYGFYEPLTNRPYVIDKCRGWGMEYEFINQYDPNPKIICMVRDLRAIYASLEKKYRANPHLDHNIANWTTLQGTTTDKRVIHWSANPPLGGALDRLYQVILDGTHKNILFIRFEDLCVNPKIELKKIYNYFELPEYNHNFNKIEQYTHEDDKVYGIFGDHTIKNELKLPKNDYLEVLGKNSCDMIVNNYPWFYEAFGYKI